MRKYIYILILITLLPLISKAAQTKTYYIIVRGQMLKCRTANPAHQKLMKAHKAKFAKRDEQGKRIKTKRKKWTDPNGIIYGDDMDYTYITRLPNWKLNPDDINDVNGVE